MKMNLEGLREPVRNIALGVAMGAAGGMIGDQNGRMNSAQFVQPAQDAQACVYRLDSANLGDTLPLECKGLAFTLKAVTFGTDVVLSPVIAKREAQSQADANYEKAAAAYKNDVKWAMNGFLAVWGLVVVAATLATIDNEEKALKGLG